MDQHCCLCLSILAAVLTNINAMNILTNKNLSHWNESLMPKVSPHFQHSNKIEEKLKRSELYSLPQVSSQFISHSVKIDANNIHKNVNTKNNFSVLLESGLNSDSQNVRNYSSLVHIINPKRKSIPQNELFVENRTPSTLRNKDSSATYINDNLKFKANDDMRDGARDLWLNVELRKTSLPSRLRDRRTDTSTDSEIMKVIEENIPVFEEQRGSRVHGVKREKRNSFWIDKGQSFLSNIGPISARTDVVYKNLIDPLTVDEREMRVLLQDTRGVESISPSIDAKYEVNPDVHNSNSGEGESVNSQDTRQDSLDGIVNDLHKVDKVILQPLEEGNFYYEDLNDASGDVRKRDNPYKDRIYALIKQGSRPTQRVSLKDSSRGGSHNRLHDKIERSQHKKQPQKPSVTKVTEGICELDRDGTTPLRCPSNKDKCLYDDMICNGTPDCPQAEDETFALCVLRHWALKWFRKIIPKS